jgi:hypothetical protein
VNQYSPLAVHDSSHPLIGFNAVAYVGGRIEQNLYPSMAELSEIQSRPQARRRKMRRFPPPKNEPRWANNILIVLVLSIFLFPAKVWAQDGIGSLIITSIDSSNFPSIQLQVLAQDASGNVLQELARDSLTIQENGETQSIFSVDPVDAGFRVAIVLDPGDGSLNTGVTLTNLHGVVMEDLRIFAVERPWMLAGIDEVTFMVQEGEQTNIVVKNVSNPEVLLHDVESYIPPVGAAKLSPEQGDFTRAALYAALKELRLSRSELQDRAEAIVLYTPGMRADLVDVAEEAISLGIPIHIVLARPDLLDYWSEPLKPLAEVTGGTFIATQEQDDPEIIFEILSHQRIQHLITYETTLGTSGNRDVVLGTTSGVTATTQYAIDLLAPSVKIVSPDEETITRKALPDDDNPVLAEPAFITVTAEIEWVDDIPRPVSQARLLVEGISVAEGQVIDDRIEIPWDLRSYGSEVATLITLQVEIVDAFGFQVRSSPQTIAIRFAKSEEGAGSPEDEIPTIRNDVFLYALGGFALLSLGLSLFLIFSRPRFAPMLQEAREGLSDLVERVTGKRTAMVVRAYLVPEEGFKKKPTKSYELFGTTAIGRSKRHADLLLHVGEEDSPISRLHCTILDEDDHFTIRDEDSSNGTYVNGKKLTPLEAIQLKDGDIIEFAPLERGGLSFKFEIAEIDQRLSQKHEEVRMTRPGRRLSSKLDRDTIDES